MTIFAGYRDEATSPADVYVLNLAPLASDTETLTVTVANVAPVITSLSTDPELVLRNRTFALELIFSDPGTLDVHQITIDWDDGNPLQVVTVPVGDRTVGVSHSYVTAGEYSVTVSLYDDDAGSAADDIIIITATPEWQNPASRWDINDDGAIAPLDVLILINYVNTHPDAPALPMPRPDGAPYYDVTGDDSATPEDALWVIHEINYRLSGGGGEGEDDLPFAAR